jgi:hypothetical protein
MTDFILTFLFYYGVAAGIVTILMGIWCWRKIQLQNKIERERARRPYLVSHWPDAQVRQNLRGWSHK